MTLNFDTISVWFDTHSERVIKSITATKLWKEIKRNAIKTEMKWYDPMFIALPTKLNFFSFGFFYFEDFKLQMLTALTSIWGEQTFVNQ